MTRSTTMVITVAASATVFLLALGCFFFGPAVAYHVLSPSLESNCSEIRFGMAREQVLRLVRERTSPPFEDLSSATRLSFARGHSVCTVDFDASTGRVAKVPVAAVGWNYDVPVGGYQ